MATLVSSPMLVFLLGAQVHIGLFANLCLPNVLASVVTSTRRSVTFLTESPSVTAWVVSCCCRRPWKWVWLAFAVVLLSLPCQISQMEVFDLYKMRPATLPRDVGNTS